MSGIVGHRGLLFGGVVITPTNRLSITNTTVGTASTTHNVSMPATVSAGDLLPAHISIPSNTPITTPVGWTLLGTATNSTFVTSAWYYKVAVGTEGGTTVNFATVASVTMVASVHRIQSGTYGVGLLSDFSVIGSSANPQSPEIPVPWGSTQNTVLTSFGTNFTPTVSSYPAGYSGPDYVATAGATSADAAHGSAIKTAVIASEAPGAFTISTARAWAAHTVIIGPNGTPALSGPTLAGAIEDGNWGTDATAHQLVLPVGIAAGERLLYFISTHDMSTQATPAGWTAAVQQSFGVGATGGYFGFYWRDANGTEGGTTLDVVTSAAQKGNASLIRLAPGTFDASVAPYVNTAQTGTGTAITPNTATPPWGTADTLFIPVVASSNRRLLSASVLGYSNVHNAWTGTNLSTDATVGFSYALYRNSTSWPANFTLAASQSWLAYTIAIKPV